MQKRLLIPLVLISFSFPASAWGEGTFRSGRPIWPRRSEKEKNLLVGFRAVFEAPASKRAVLRVAGSTIYRVFVNGAFRGHGPARGPHEYFRVDEWDLADHLVPGKNLVAIEVAGYNVNGYYLISQPSFLQAEVVSGEEVLASTGGEGVRFEAGFLRARVQRVQRYSFQRPFSEVYRLWPGYDGWRTQIAARFETAECATLAAGRLLPRAVPYPKFLLRSPIAHVSQGKVKTGVEVKPLWKDRSLTDIGAKLGGFEEKELEVIPSIELQKVATAESIALRRPWGPEGKLSLPENSYHLLDFGTNLTGFLGAKITSHKRTRLFFTFDEILTKGDVDFKRLSCVNIVGYEMPAGTFLVESLEPYTLRYLKLIVLEGDCEIEKIYLREYVNPEVEEAQFAASDERLNRLFAAGKETFRQNAVDIFMDCPSRERAGWLCDSFFTSRVAFDLCGNATVEKNFLENFLLPQQFAHLPEGMLPMCYPADHYDGVFIPNWALWFVIQLEEYLARSGDQQMVEAFRPKVLRLFDYFRPFQNQDGLLEKLQSWVFVEWSDANRFVQDVNYPTNMLYAAALAAAGRMYHMPQLVEEAEKVRQVIRRQSFDGDFFVDNATRAAGKLQITRNRTEVCQYFAFFFDVASPATHARLWQVLRQKFGPHRKETKEFPEIGEANAFIGNMLRLEILARYGLGQQVLDESVDYLLYMAEQTGTLWENVGAYASCNHGFASHIVRTLYRDVLGLRQVDAVNRAVRIRFPDVRLSWCEGQVPVRGGVISLRWWKESEKMFYRLNVPAGYQVKIENASGKELVRQTGG